jgi:hypothetical protein
MKFLKNNLKSVILSALLMNSANAVCTMNADAGGDRIHNVTNSNTAVHLVSTSTCTEDIESYKWYKQDGTFIGPHESRWYVLTEAGEHNITLRTEDAMGNTDEDTIKITVTNNIIPHPNPNDAPTASDVIISGTPKLGETLTLDYTFADPNGDSEGDSIIVWSTPTQELQRTTSREFNITDPNLIGEEIGAWVHVIDDNGVEMARAYDYAATNNTLTILNSLMANAGVDKDITLTPSNQQVLLEGVATGGTAPFKYKWSYANGDYIGPNQSRWLNIECGETLIKLTVTDAYEYTAEDTISVTASGDECI